MAFETRSAMHTSLHLSHGNRHGGQPEQAAAEGSQGKKLGRKTDADQAADA